MNKFLDFVTEAVIKGKTHVMTFMRANPPTIGHERVVNQVKQLATDLGGDHTVVLSHSHDGQKNPLTADQKLRHAKRAFPNTNVITSSPTSPSFLHIASDLHKKGVKNLHVVVGQDRVDEFNNILHKYNGQEGRHGFFDFDNIQIHSAGDRDPDSEGIEGVSGTSQRKHALTGNRDLFHLGAPSVMAPEHKDELMNDIIKGTVASAPKPKKLKEETTSAGDAVRGFGDVSGNPAVDEDPLQQYITTNELAKDKENGALLKLMKQSQYNLVGFKEFHPNARDKSLQYYKDDENADPLLIDKIRNRNRNNNTTKG